ncbi:MAG: peptidylprolyl isomerase [Spirochaetales bacterium]|nr:peptidylprolyl isomerase [Spirochaetales bacterium]
MKKLYRILAASVMLCVLLAGCGKTDEVTDRKFVSLQYRGTLSDGSQFDASEEGRPLEFIYGMGMMIPGFEKGIAGMHVGEERTFSIKAEDAYGPYNEELIVPVPKTSMPSEIEIEVGMRFMLQTIYGPRPVVVKAVSDTEIFLDYNAPLAGQDLTFYIKILDIHDPTEEELQPFQDIREDGSSAEDDTP